MEKILLVEDVDTLRNVIATILRADGYEVDAFPDAEQAREALQSTTYSCILADFKLPRGNGLELLTHVRRISRTVPFILMTAFGSIEIAVEAMKQGANDFICKPFEPQMLSTVIAEVLKHRRIITRERGSAMRRERSFLSATPGMQKILDQARRVAQVDTSVLILGESGTGKELLARFMHEHSRRHEQNFIAVNCAAMPGSLLESEFFGHEAGSFTGATQTRIGILEVASEGTIFLDEVGDMPHALQVKLLRALQEKEIKRVGSNQMLKVNPRIIAATHCNIEEALEQKTVREDLYYRLAVVTFVIPPLRERPDDIELLTNFYVSYFAKSMGRTGLAITAEALDLIKRYPWPGNARELENTIERAVILADHAIAVEHLGLANGIDLQALHDASLSLTEVASRAAMRAEIDLITSVMNQTKGNKTKAARLLGVSYKTLLNKIKDYCLEEPRPESESVAQ